MTRRKVPAVASERSKHVDGGILNHSISFLIYRSHRAAAHAWIGRWGERGMRYGFYSAFVAIGANPGILLVELAHFLGIDKSRASELIEALHAQGANDIVVVVGGVIPAHDYQFLYDAGVSAIFGPGSNITRAASEILALVRKRRANDAAPA